MTSSRTQTIELPCKIFLSSEGHKYCQNRQIPLEKLTSLEGVRGMGFNRPVIVPQLIRQLTANNLITRIELENTHFTSSRQALLSTTKLICFGILYRRFRPAMKALLLDSEIVRFLQKQGKFPTKDNNLAFSPQAISRFTAHSSRTVQSMKTALLQLPNDTIEQNQDMNEEKKDHWKHIGQNFVNAIENETWFLLSYVRRSPDYKQVLLRMQTMLIAFMRKTTIADAIAFMLMELIQNAETEHFKYLALKDNMARVKGEGIFEMLRNEEFRHKMLKKAKNSNSLLRVVYHFENLHYTDNSKKTRLRVSVTNKGRMDVAGMINKSCSKDSRTDISLVDHLLSDPDSMGAPLGMVYYNLLENACREQKVKLESGVSTNAVHNETTALMKVTI